MPALKRSLNHRHILLDDDTKNETVGVRRRDGSWQYIAWLGFISLEEAKAIGRPVRLNITAVSYDPILCGWSRLHEGESVQGCLVEGGVYGVLVAGKPRIVVVGG